MMDRMSFAIMPNDGGSPLELAWHSGTALPDLNTIGVVSARKRGINCGYDFATARAKCPDCGTIIDVTPSSVAPGADCGAAGHQIVLLDPSSTRLLDITSNITAVQEDAEMLCPSCGRMFPIRLPGPGGQEMRVLCYEDRVEVEFTHDERVTFWRNGALSLGRKPVWMDLMGQLDAFKAIPKIDGSCPDAMRFIAWSLEVGVEELLAADGIDLLVAAIHNRFRHYGETFVQEFKRALLDPGIPDAVKKGMFLLPRDGKSTDSVRFLLKLTGLPPVKSVMRSAARRPVLLGAIASTDLGRYISGYDPNVAVRLFEDKRAGVHLVSALVDSSGSAVNLIRAASKVEVPSKLLDALLAARPARLKHVVEALGETTLLDMYGAFRLARKNHSLADLLSNPKHIAAFLGLPGEIPISYSKDQLALSGQYRGCDFSIPMNIGEMRLAGSELKNCLGGSHIELVVLGQSLVVLVSERRKIKAAVEMDNNNREIVQMAAKANRPIGANEPLGMAIAEWAAENGIVAPAHVFAHGGDA